MPRNYITKLLGIQGFVVKGIELKSEGDRTKVILDLERKPQDYICSQCGRKVKEAIPYRQRVVQHLTLWQHLTFLRFMQYRVICPNCGLKVEALSFLDRYNRVTVHLASLVYELCKVMTNKAVAMFQHLHRTTVKEIDKEALQKAQANRSLEGITTLGVDEISVGAGQTYWHLISALDGAKGPEVLYVGEGRKERDLRKFWVWFGEEKTRKIKVGVMDMWKGFINSFRAHCPRITIVYDKFHIIRHLLEALNKVRKQELRRAGKRLKGLLAGKKFMLLSRQAHVRGKARVALNQLLSLSRRLFKAHLLKENFSHLWSYRSKTWAKKFWAAWKETLKWSRLKSYKTFAKMIDEHLDGILGFCDYKVSLGFIEATNLKARNIIRRAYGYRDKEYMKLKIIQVCSSLGEFNPWSFSFNNST